MGYVQTTVYKDGEPFTIEIHRLVAYEFCDPPENWRKLDVHHIDEDKENNRYTNFAWLHRNDHRRREFLEPGRESPLAKLDKDKVFTILEEYETLIDEWVDRYGVSRATLIGLITGKGENWVRVRAKYYSTFRKRIPKRPPDGRKFKFPVSKDDDLFPI